MPEWNLGIQDIHFASDKSKVVGVAQAESAELYLFTISLDRFDFKILELGLSYTSVAPLHLVEDAMYSVVWLSNLELTYVGIESAHPKKRVFAWKEAAELANLSSIYQAITRDTYIAQYSNYEGLEGGTIVIL